MCLVQCQGDTLWEAETKTVHWDGICGGCKHCYQHRSSGSCKSQYLQWNDSVKVRTAHVTTWQYPFHAAWHVSCGHIPFSPWDRLVLCGVLLLLTRVLGWKVKNFFMDFASKDIAPRRQGDASAHQCMSVHV